MKRSDSVLWQKSLHQQTCQQGKVTTQTTPQKSLHLGRSVGVTTATQLVRLKSLTMHWDLRFRVNHYFHYKTCVIVVTCSHVSIILRFSHHVLPYYNCVCGSVDRVSRSSSGFEGWRFDTATADNFVLFIVKIPEYIQTFIYILAKLSLCVLFIK